jgi:hypothetical protein
MTAIEAEPQKAQPTTKPGDNGISSRLRARWVEPAAFTALGIVLFFAYLTQARKLPVYGDGSAQALQAWDMLHGNVLLHGWVLSDVSFYTTELPQYMLIELARGLSADVVHMAAAMTYTLLVLATALLAKGRATGREALVRVLIPIGIMLAPPLGNPLTSRATSPVWVLLSAPDHTGTQVPLVLIWLLLDRLRPRWWVPVVVAALLAWVQIADPTALYEGALPIVLVCGVRMYRRRGPLAGQWYDLSLAVGALVSAGVAMTALKLIRSAGGFVVHPATPAFTSIHGFTANIWLKVFDMFALFGANFAGTRALHAVIPLAHLIAIALVAWAVAHAVRQYLAEDDLTLQVLTASFVVLLAAFILGYRTGAREVVGLLPIGSVLAGRLLATRVLRGGLAPVLAVVLVCDMLFLVHNVYQSALPSPDRRLASWLQANHLTYGLSTTWLASSGITMYSLNSVQVRDVRLVDGVPVRLRWNTEASWYDPRLHDARFLILDGAAVKSARTLIRAVGQPAAEYRVAGYTVYVWHKNLLAGPFADGPAGPGRLARQALASAMRCATDADQAADSRSGQFTSLEFRWTL